MEQKAQIDGQKADREKQKKAREAVGEEMQQTLRRMEAMQAELDQARDKSAQTEQKMQDFQREKVQLIQQRETARASQEDAEGKLAEATGEVQKLREATRASQEDAKGKLAEASREVKKLREDMNETNEKSKQELAETERELTAARRAQAETKRALEELRLEKDREISKLREDLEDAQSDFAEAQRNMESRMKTAASAREVKLLKRQCMDVLRENQRVCSYRDHVSDGFPQWFQALSETAALGKPDAGSGIASRIGINYVINSIGGMSGVQTEPGPYYEDISTYEFKVFIHLPLSFYPPPLSFFFFVYIIYISVLIISFYF